MKTPRTGRADAILALLTDGGALTPNEIVVRLEPPAPTQDKAELQRVRMRFAASLRKLIATGRVARVDRRAYAATRREDAEPARFKELRAEAARLRDALRVVEIRLAAARWVAQRDASAATPRDHAYRMHAVLRACASGAPIDAHEVARAVDGHDDAPYTGATYEKLRDLVRRGLLAQPSRGRYQITPVGRRWLLDHEAR